MNYREFIREERLPTSWCPGCGNGVVFHHLCHAFVEEGFSHEGLVVVSGIGCVGRSAGYFNLDTVHGLHGRALPLAEGLKVANPDLKVVVISGDGDLLAIGGNHLIHAGRRGINLKVFCVNNEIYGMTGGQVSPTTKLEARTLTTPGGNPERSVDVQSLVKAYKNFYARATVFHIPHLKKSIKAALQYNGFAFVEVISTCPVNYGRRIGQSASEMLRSLKEFYKLNDGAELLKEDEIGVTV